MREIRRVAVIGAGVMGSGIAAHVANAGVPVLLYDVSGALAQAALARLSAATSSPFMVPGNAALVRACGLDADMALLGDCDWIVEAVVENLAVKQDLYGRLAVNCNARAIVSSNTSTIRRADLVAGTTAHLRSRFLVTHFFNPPRQMRLVELVSGADVAPEAVATFAGFADRRLGKTIVACRDSPGFIANRLGCFWMQLAMAEAVARGLSVEEADAAMGKPFGIPPTGVFGLADLVGIDLIPKVNASLAAALSTDDLFQSVNTPLAPVVRMIAAGRTGRKAGGGFYRLDRASGLLEALDLETLAYRPLRRVALDQDSALIEQATALGDYARAVMLKTLAYAAQLVGDAAEDAGAIDDAMRLGYNWRLGPFALIDHIGRQAVVDFCASQHLQVAPLLRIDAPSFYRNGTVLALDGTYRPPARPEGVLRLEDIKQRGPAVLANAKAALWDLGGGIACFEIASKMNTLDALVFDLLEEAVGAAEQDFRALVVYSDAADFSAGVDLRWLEREFRRVGGIEAIADRGLKAFRRLKYAHVPTIAAVAGRVLGGGCELALHATAIQAHAECAMGLVESNVGILPGWGGLRELLARLAPGPPPLKPDIARVFALLAKATVSQSAPQARALGFLRPSDGITMNRDRLLADACTRAGDLASDYVAPKPFTFLLPGEAMARTLLVAPATSDAAPHAHEGKVAEALTRVLTGGAGGVVNERELDGLVRAELADLATSPAVAARIAHLLETGKPLRN